MICFSPAPTPVTSSASSTWGSRSPLSAGWKCPGSGRKSGLCHPPDFYGTTQVVVETEDMMKLVKSINKESTIRVEGIVRERDSKNPKLPTGDIEVLPSKIEVLGRCRYHELPFPINRSREADEAARLKYRYLDLRIPL